MNASNMFKRTLSEQPTKQEKKILKEQGVNMKDHKAVIAATKELREKNAPAPVPPKPTQEELLTQILAELKKQNAPLEKIEEIDKENKETLKN